MSRLSEQIKHLRELSDTARSNVYSFEALSQSLNQSADTIEALSAKLQAANMENGGGWIACEDRLPEESGDYLITNEDGNSTCAYYSKNGNWWCGIEEGCIAFYPVAWQPLPEPYRP